MITLDTTFFYFDVIKKLSNCLAAIVVKLKKESSSLAFKRSLLKYISKTKKDYRNAIVSCCQVANHISCITYTASYSLQLYKIILKAMALRDEIDPIHRSKTRHGNNPSYPS